MASYSKFVAAIVATILTAVIAALSDSRITPVEWVMISIAGVNAVQVVLVPNLPSGVGLYTKALVAVLMAVLGALVTMIVGGVSGSEWLELAVLALGAVGVFAVPNAPAKPAPSLQGGRG